MKLIGNKNEFAVEYQVTDVPNKMGYAKLWIQNKFYGTNQDLIYLSGYLVKLIKNIVEAKPLNFPLDDSNEDNIYRQFAELSEETSEYLITSSSFTDDFIGYKFKDGENVVLVWRIRNDVEMIFDDLKDYTKSTTLVKVNLQTVAEVMNKFIAEIEK